MSPTCDHLQPHTLIRCGDPAAWVAHEKLGDHQEGFPRQRYYCQAHHFITDQPLRTEANHADSDR